VYLSMLGNQKPDVAHNIRPDENYARELMQLFTVGLVELNLDGSVKTDSAGQPIPTYDQDIVQGFAHVYTGWTYSGAPSFAAAIPTIANQIRPMQAYSEQHATGRRLNYPRRPDARAGSRRRTRQHLQPSQCRAVHRAATDSAPGDEQSVAAVRRTYRPQVQR
jgi:uncharacterized protein (DUF1800 family)